MYKSVSAEEILSIIDVGWHPTWFAVEDSTFKIDLCVNYRLNDGKLLFLEFYSTDIKCLSDLAHKVAKKTKDNWIETIDEMTVNLEQQIDEVIESEKNIASIQWKENQKYLFTYVNGKQSTYKCVCACDNDIYVQEIVDENAFSYYLYNSDQNVRKVVSGDTKIELID